jgi:hypothetical protein
LVLASLIILMIAGTSQWAAAQDAQSFKTFTSQVVVNQRQQSTASVGRFTLGDGSDGVSLLTDDVSLQIGNIALAIPAGSFNRIFTGGYLYFKTVGTMKIAVLIQPLGGANYSYYAAVQGAVPGANPVAVSLAIGNDSGSTSVNAYVY